MKPVRVRIYGFVENGRQCIGYDVVTRARMQRLGLRVMLYPGEDNRFLVHDAWRRFREGWRESVLGKD